MWRSDGKMHHATIWEVTSFRRLTIFVLFSLFLYPPSERKWTLVGIIIYHRIDLYQPWKIARGRADITLATGWYSIIATGVYKPQRMRQRRTSLIGCCDQRATASPICKHRSRRSIVLSFSKVIFNIIQIIFAYPFRRVRSYNKEVITQLFSYQHLYQALGQMSTLGLDIGADMKTAVW